MANAHHRTVAWGAAHGVTPRAVLGHADRMMEADRMRNPALVVLGGDNPDLVGEPARDLFEHGEARRLDAVVVAEQHAIQHATARLSAKAVRLFSFFWRPFELDHVAVRI